MAINSSNAVLKGIQAVFAEGISVGYKPVLQPFADAIKSNSNNEIIYISAGLPGFVEWTGGDDKSGEYKDYQYTITNKHWIRSIEVNRDTLEDSKLYLGGTIETKVKGLTQLYNVFADAKIQAIIDANGNAFDGSAFFATSRSFDTGSNTINNLVSGTLSSYYTTTTFTADFQSAYNLIAGYMDKNGLPFNPQLDLVAIIPAQHKAVAEKVLNGEMGGLIYTGATETAVWRGSAEVLTNTYQVTTNNDWYLVNRAAIQKPFFITDRQPLKWSVIDNPDNINIKYQADFRQGFGYHNPMSIVKINN